MKNNIILFYLLAIIIFGSCSKPIPTTGIMITEEMEDLPPAKLSELVDSISYIRLETNKNCVMGHASRNSLLCTPVGIVINARFGKSPPMLFSYSGKFVRKIGRAGRGPGEFLAPKSIAYDDEKEQFLITHHRSIHFYSVEGEYIRSIKLETENRAVSNVVLMPENKLAALYHERKETQLNDVGVLILNSEGAVIRTYNLTDPIERGSYRGRYTSNNLYMNEGKLIFSNGTDRKILSLNKKGEWQTECMVDYYFPRMPIKYLSQRISSEESNEYAQNNPTGFYALLSGDFIRIMYSTPMGIQLYINRINGNVYRCGYDRSFNGFGLQNDLDGGRPVQIKSFREDKSYELIDMSNIFWDIENMANNSENVDSEMYQAFQGLLKELDPNDNPLIRISYLKKESD